MKVLTIKEIKELTNLELNKIIIEIQSELFNLKFQKATQKSVKSHLFKKYKKMLAQSLTVKSTIQ
jgi:ribosomal protein L29